MSDTVRLKAGRHRVEITSPGKDLFPGAGISKEDLARYYIRIAETALPLWRDRPLTMERYPDGIDSSGFIQKQKGDYFPEWIESARLRKKDGAVDYVLPQNGATLAYLANQGMITPHLGLSRVDRIDRPDRLIFDLDPSTESFEPVRQAAVMVREALEDLGATPFVMSTGSRGLHVVVPLDRSAGFEAARGFAHSFADGLAQRHPEKLTTEQRKSKRGNRLFLDYLRNAYGQTGVAPYGVRARPGAPVATPLEWDELKNKKLGPQSYTIRNIFRRLGQRADPWSDIQRHSLSVDALQRRLDKAG